MFKKINIMILVFITLFLFAGCEKNDERIDCMRFGVLRVEDAIPVYVSEKLELFKDDVEVIVFSNTREMDLALEAGVIDGILSDLVRTILLKSGDEDVRIVASASPIPSPKRKFAIVSSPKSNIYAPKDLKNKEIAVSKNSIISFLADKMIEDKKINKDSVVYKSVPDIKLRFESLINSSLELALLPEPLVTSAEQEGARIIISDLELAKNYSQTVYIFRKEYIEKNYEKVESFLKTISYSGKMLNSDPEKYMNLVADKSGISEKILENYRFYSIEKILLPELKTVEEVNKWMLEKELTTKKYSYEELVEKSFSGDLE